MTDTILIDGIPNITIDKVKKLEAVLRKKIIDCTQIKNIDFNLIVDNNEVKKFVFIKHSRAKDLVTMLNNYPFDKKHMLTCTLLSDFNNILSTPDKYVPIDYTIKNADDIYNYIDKKSCSKFLVHSETSIDIYKNNYQLYNNTDFLTLIKNNIDISDIKYINFSNTGKYLSIITSKNVMLYIKEELTFFTSFDIENILIVKFSSMDSYIILYDSIYIYTYNILTNKLVKKIKTQIYDINFSYNEDFLIFKTKLKLGILNITKNTIDYIEDVSKFCISNKSNLIMCFKHYTDNKPSQINIINLNNMNVLITKNIYDISHIDLYWNDKKAVIIIKRNGKNDIINIFNINNQEVSNIVIELDNRCIVFGWCNSKFAIIDDKHNFILFNNKEILRIKNKKYKQIISNPFNNYILLSNILCDNEIELFNLTNEESTIISFKGCTNIEWDPTGRFFILYSSKYFINKNNSYKLYTFQGDLIDEQNVNKLLKIEWRCTPNDIISNHKKNKIKHNINNYKDILESIIKDENSFDCNNLLMIKRLQLLHDFKQLERVINSNI